MMEQTPPTQGALSSFATDATVAREVTVRDGGQSVDERQDPSKAAVTVEHVADFNRRYPGETLTFFTRVNIREAIPGFSLRVQVPAGLEITDYSSDSEGLMPVFVSIMQAGARELVMMPGIDGAPFPVTVPHQQTRAIEPSRMSQDMIWRVSEPQEAGSTLDFVVAAVVLPIHKDVFAHSIASLAITDGNDEESAQTINSATTSVAIYRAAASMEYLPSVYEQDNFIGRFLMLFESFWRPIDQQIASIDNYFDPDLTPARFLPWLASWFDLTLDEFWEEAQQRELLNSVMWLYRRRGTRVAMQRYLEIFSRNPVEILEKRARNLALGKNARLGVGVALGTGNMPHTFTVKIKLNPIVAPAEMNEEDAAIEITRIEKQRLALIHRMIMAEKPAHTSYRLQIIE